MLSILLLKILFGYFVMVFGGLFAVIFCILTFKKSSSHHHDGDHSHDAHH